MTQATATRPRVKVSTIVVGDGEIGFTLGNYKLPMTTAIWNLPAISTCPGAFSQGCGFMVDGKKRGHCYALKAERLYPQTLPARMRNYEASRKRNFGARMQVLVQMLRNYRRIPVDKVRIHESGDFYNQRYLNVWLKLARNNPDITFYAYTKSVYLDFSKRPKNFIVLLSDDRGIWKDEWHRFDKIFAIDLPGADMQCGQDCTVCSACVSGPRLISVEKH